MIRTRQKNYRKILSLALWLISACRTGFAVADSLPPLPDLSDLTLKFPLPKESFTRADTSRFLVSGGLFQPIKSFDWFFNGAALIPLHWQNKFFSFYSNCRSDIDYEPFWFFSAAINSNLPIRHSLLTNHLSFECKKRANVNYENLSLLNWSIHPIALGELDLKFRFRVARFFLTEGYQFYNLSLQNDYLVPTRLGDFGLGGSFLIQKRTDPLLLFNLFHHIIPKKLITLKPYFGWSTDRNFTFGITLGSKVGKATGLLQFSYNDKQLISLDSIYRDAGPFKINETLHYPISQYRLSGLVRVNNQEFNFSLRFDTNQIHIVQSQSLLRSENSLKKSANLRIELKNSLPSLIKSWLIAEVNWGNLSLTPVWVISFHPSVFYKNFSWQLTGELVGKRKLADRELKPVFRTNGSFSYSISTFRLSLGCNNIFESNWEIYPNYFDKYRKIFLQLEAIKIF